MKKFFKAIIAVLLAVSLMGLTACDFFGGLFGNKNSNDPKVTLVLDGGTLSENLTSYKEGTETVLPVPTKENYDFDGWHKAADFSDEAVTKISADETGSKIFYAKWTPKKFTVTLNLDGGTVATNLTEYTYGVGATLPVPTKAPFTFDGWFDSEEGGNKVTAISKTDSGNKTLWAKWSGVKSKLTLVLNGGTLSEEVTTYEEGVEKLLPTPDKENYDFEGWHIKEDLSDKKVDKITADKTGELTYYAKYTPKKYSVTLNLNGGTATSLTQYTYGTGATLPEPTRTGYNFEGWYETLNFSGDPVTAITKTDSGNKTYYAKWSSGTALTVSDFGGYDEGAYLEFNKLSGVSITNYKVSYKISNGAAAYTQIDKELVREISSTKIRADVVGLKAGNYTLKVEADNKTVTKDVTVTAYDRSGYAHFDASTGDKVYANGVGAYKNDGTKKDNAQIIYVTEATKNTVSVTWDKTYTGIVQILGNASKCSKPLIVRIVGTIKAATWNELRYVSKSGTKITVDKVVSSDNSKTLKTHIDGLSSSDNIIKNKRISQQELIDLGYNTLNTEDASVLNNLSSRATFKLDSNNKVTEFDSCWNDCSIPQAQNVTVEGIGTDAGLFQWGMTWSKSNSIEVRNLTFTDYTEDACSFEGGTNATEISGFDSSRIWLHHNTFNRGKNYWDVCPEQDKWDGDGGTDFKRVAYVSIAYNTYNNNHKTGLIGADDASMTANVTFHHNYYNNCEARLPLARQANMHMYNNYYLGNGKTGSCLSIRSGAYAFVEYCYFDNANAPIACVLGTKKLETDANYLQGYAKVYNCTFNKIDVSTTDYLKKTDDRTIKYNTDCRFGKSFDTDASAFYYDATNKCSKVTNLIATEDIPEQIPQLAGVHK